MSRQKQQLQDPHAVEESKMTAEEMPAFVGQGPRRREVTLEVLFAAILDLKKDVRELKQALHMKVNKAQ